MWDLIQTWQSAPVAQSTMLQVNDTPHGRRTRLPPEIRVPITWDGAGMLATRPRSRFVPQASGDLVFTG